MTTKLMPVSDLAIPPGEYLEEVLDSLGMNKDELAQRMGRPAPKLSAIFSGKKAITPETALQLERVTGVSAHIWSSLEAEYRLISARKKMNDTRQQLKSEEQLVADYCYPALKKLGVVKDMRLRAEKAEELRRYFGVSALSNVPAIRRYQPVFRRGRGNAISESRAVAAWLRFGEIRGQEARCAPFNRNALLADLGRLRRLTRQAPVALKDLLAGLGIVLVLCPHFPKTYVNGAVFWLGQNKAVLMPRNRGRWADIFWFTLFHQIGHLVLHSKEGTILEGATFTQKELLREKEADRFAQDALISPEAFSDFEGEGVFTRVAVERFAEEHCVHPGIVVGRLQYEELVPHNSVLNRLRERFTLTMDD